MRKIILILSAIIASGILFVNIYNSVVDAANWGRDIPASLMAARQYFVAANPGTFFRVVSPLNQVLTLLALIICWPAGSRVRLLCGAALVCAVAGDVLTFAYFYPRNAILFAGPPDTSVDLLRATWEQWTTMNWFRSAIIAAEVAFDSIALLIVAKDG